MAWINSFRPRYGQVDAVEVETESANGHLPIARENGSASPKKQRSLDISQFDAPLPIALWTLSSAISLITSKRLLVDKTYYFPMHLLLFQLLATTAMVVFNAIWDARASARSRPVFAEVFTSPNDWLPVLPAAVAQAFSLTLLSHAIFHLTNLPTLVMLAAVSYLCEAICVRVFGKASKPYFFVRCAVVVVACYFILHDEYRLTADGLLFAIPGSIMAGLSKGLYVAGYETWSVRSSRPLFPMRFLSITVSLAATIALIWLLAKEESDKALYRITHMPGRFTTVLPNLVFSAIALSIGSSLLLPISAVQGGILAKSWRLTQTQIEIASNFCLSGFTAIGSLALTRRGYSTPIQVLAYMIAMACLATATDLPASPGLALELAGTLAAAPLKDSHAALLRSDSFHDIS